VKSKNAYIVIAHGSREVKANTAFEGFVRVFRKTFPKRQVYGAFLGMAKPSVPDSLEKAIREGAGNIFILPLMFFPGRHIKEDIPKMIAEAKMKHPQVDFHYAGPVAEHPMMSKLLKANIRTAKRLR
jgi:sirohydrochlorin cobaltochelatase